MLPRLIGVTGFKRSGKDTFAKVLVDKIGYKRLAFADALKKEVAEFLGIPVEELEMDKEKWRGVLQYHGCAVRWKDEDHWVDCLSEYRDRLRVQCPTKFVVSDVRFRNEANWIRSEGGVVVRIVRDGIVAADPSWHESERQVAEIEADYTLDANTVEVARQNAIDLIEEWRTG